MVGEDRGYALEVIDIHKSFFSNHVLKGISMGIKKGEVLGLVGSNGAGKSTLMKIINGVYKNDSGVIKVDGQPVNYRDPEAAKKCKVAMVYQEFSLIPTMTVSENLFLGVEPKRNGLIDDGHCEAEARKAFAGFGVDIDPNVCIDELSIGNQQIVEIVKALMQKPSILILDEPTASLTHKEIDLLFTFVKKLRETGIAVLMISHHMNEILKICDRVVVLRNGEVVLDTPIQETSVPQMVQAMIGRTLKQDEFIHPSAPIRREKPMMRVENLTVAGKVHDISFDVYPGEILGIAGLMGSGRTELLKAIYGLIKPQGGKVLLKEQETVHGKPWEQIAKGIFLVPENRRESGIVGIHSIHMNMLLPVWPRYLKNGLIDEKRSRSSAEVMKDKLKLKATGIDQEVQSLSGGNQQKTVFAKSLLIEPTVLLLDEPTVGIDVEAKSEIAQLIRTISDQGNGVLLVTSEMDEMARLCDRVLVLKQGRVHQVIERVTGAEITEHTLSEIIQA